jgi:hypothetical protein
MEEYRNGFCSINQKGTETEVEVGKDEMLESRRGNSLRVSDTSDSKLGHDINWPGYLDMTSTVSATWS